MVLNREAVGLIPLVSGQLSGATETGRKWKGNQGEWLGGIPVIHTGDAGSLASGSERENTDDIWDIFISQNWQGLGDSIDWRWRDKEVSKATLTFLERKLSQVVVKVTELEGTRGKRRSRSRFCGSWSNILLQALLRKKDINIAIQTHYKSSIQRHRW